MSLKRLENKNRELNITINNLNEELMNANKQMHFTDDSSNFDSLINSYKRKLAQLNSQLEDQQRTIDNLSGDNHSMRLQMNSVKMTSTVNVSNNENNLKQEIDILN